jgi:TatD DNase family protein
MLVDTHCHLDAAEFDADRDAVAARAAASGVGCMVVPAVERANFAAVASVSRDYPACVPAYGIHPLYVDRAQAQDLLALREVLGRGDAVAVGEIGLDFYVAERDEARQREYFASQLDIAAEFGLPVILHVRRAVDAVLKLLCGHRVCGGIAHSFNGSPEQARGFIDLGFKLGFGGAMTFDGSQRIRRLAATLPAETLVLETDAPDIPPQWLERARNQPAELARIAGVLAHLRDAGADEVAAMTTANAIAALPRLAGAPALQP